MEPEKLSDSQLYALIMNKTLPKGTQLGIYKEFERRDFELSYLDKLALEYELENKKKQQNELSSAEKFRIILFPFIVPLQAILANRYIKKMEVNKWNQYWKYLGYGFLFWTFLVILFVRLLRGN